MSSFEDRVGAVVQGILADQMNWPPEMTSAIPQIVAQSPVATAAAAGELLTWATHDGSPSTAGTTFGTGVDLLSSALEFTAQGSNSYFFLVCAPGWALNTSPAALNLHFNLDGADDGIMGQATSTVNNAVLPCTFGTPFGVANGQHSVNARLVVAAGTGTVFGASAGGYTPILAALYQF